MATLIVILHEFDVFRLRDRISGKVGSPYLLFDVLKQLEALGHHAIVCRGAEAADVGSVRALMIRLMGAAQAGMDIDREGRRVLRRGVQGPSDTHTPNVARVPRCGVRGGI